MFTIIFYLFLVACGVESHRQFERRIDFLLFSDKYPQGRISTIDEDISDNSCKRDGNFSIITHGWLEGSQSNWVHEMIREFLNYRGNCVIFMDYSFYTKRPYTNLRQNFQQISSVLLKKVLSIGNYENIVMFGFSFGARLVMDVGIDVNEKEKRMIDKIYACDPPGIGFAFYLRDPKKAAKFVQCINTSTDKGTSNYNCHQNWRLGECGNRQIASGKFPMGSHGLCPFFFAKSFRHDFIAKNAHNCKSSRFAMNLPSKYIMGIRETRENYFGDIFAPTSRHSPWNVIEENYESENSKETTTEMSEVDTQNEISNE